MLEGMHRHFLHWTPEQLSCRRQPGFCQLKKCVGHWIYESNFHVTIQEFIFRIQEKTRTEAATDFDHMPWLVFQQYREIYARIVAPEEGITVVEAIGRYFVAVKRPKAMVDG